MSDYGLDPSSIVALRLGTFIYPKLKTIQCIDVVIIDMWPRGWNDLTI